MSHMSEERKLEYLINHRIIYRRNPISDKPTASFHWGDYYEYGTNECYELFKSKAKINTYKSLRWHLLVLWYLNPQLDKDSFETISRFIVDEKNGFTTFKVSDNALSNIIDDISIEDLEKPPKNKSRKIIFKDMCGLSTNEKLKIVGSIIGRKKISNHDIYDCMLHLNYEGEVITIERLSKLLKCSTRTIHRNMSSELKKEKELLNKEIL
jgi:hypothetical protein